MNSDNLITSIAVVAVLVSFVGAGFTYYTVNEYRDAWLTGFATNTGDINLTVESAALINFTIDNINWGSGQVDAGQDNATLNTCCGGSVVDGNWTTVSDGFEVRNIGNVNLTLNLRTGLDAEGFIGGTAGGGPIYQYNVTNVKADSCTAPGTFTLGTFNNVNTTSPGTRVCDNFQFADASDTIRIDIRLVVPSDSRTGALSDTMTATVSSV
jgi:hypothetical protein